MSDSEIAIIASGRRWMDGRDSGDEYFAKVRRSAARASGLRLLGRLGPLVGKVLGRRTGS
ncbi:hypothetical protein ACIQGZ_21330 [Streptomyces sp. NPDC092296]|uniref:hypothetical protein n=1 Tax=Streptomyces sp. NPDC092296 TaxID=3366012 RepID=UPI00380ABA1C